MFSRAFFVYIGYLASLPFDLLTPEQGYDPDKDYQNNNYGNYAYRCSCFKYAADN